MLGLPTTYSHSISRCRRVYNDTSLQYGLKQTGLVRPGNRRGACCLAARHDGRASASVHAFDMDTAVLNTAPVVLAAAWSAAQQLWPDRVVGSKELYIRKGSEVMPVISEAHEAVLLTRLLADEGIIGARSTAGREGPVVGRPLRHNGSRPLLTAELAEHWASVADSCLLRWSLEDSISRGVLLQRVQAAFAAAQCTLMDQPDGRECIARVQLYPHAVEALRGCARPFRLVSWLPPGVVEALLARSGLAHLTPHTDVIPGASLQLPLLALDGAHRRHVHFVTGNLGRVEQLAGQLQLVHAKANAQLDDNGSSSTTTTTSSSSSNSTSSRQEHSSSSSSSTGRGHACDMHAGQEIDLHLAEWSCTSVSLRARALSHPGVRLIAEHEMAELLGVTHLRLVMDGVAWS